MALPTYNDQISLDFVVNGLPYFNLAGTTSIVANGTEFFVNGLPYIAVSPSGAPPVSYNATQFFMLF